MRFSYLLLLFPYSYAICMESTINLTLIPAPVTYQAKFIPKEIKFLILQKLFKKSDQKKEELQQAALYARRFMQIPVIHNNLDKAQLTNDVIDHLALECAGNDKREAAIYLRTEQSAQWLKSFFSAADLRNHFINTAMCNRINECKFMLTLYPGLINVSNKIQNTALHIACREGYIKLISLLIKKGANMHILNKFRETALDIAIFKCHVEAIKLLYKAGSPVRPWKESLSDVSPFSCFVNESTKKEIIQLLKEHNPLGY